MELTNEIACTNFAKKDAFAKSLPVLGLAADVWSDTDNGKTCQQHCLQNVAAKILQSAHCTTKSICTILRTAGAISYGLRHVDDLGPEAQGKNFRTSVHDSINIIIDIRINLWS